MPKTAKPQPAQTHTAAQAVFRMLLDYFSGDHAKALDFARAFAGVNLRVPNAEPVELIARDRRILVALKRDPSTECVRRLAQTHGAPMRLIAKSFAKSNGVGLKQLRAARAVRDGNSPADDAGERSRPRDLYPD